MTAGPADPADAAAAGRGPAGPTPLEALGVLASQTDPWVPAYKKDQPRDYDYTFHGYELDAQRRPTFKWEYKGVAVTEFFEQSGNYKKQDIAIKRTVTLSAKKPVENLYFLALTGPMESKDGAFIFDKMIKATVSGGEPIVRKNGANSEVLLPVTFKDGKAQFTVNYSWNIK